MKRYYVHATATVEVPVFAETEQDAIDMFKQTKDALLWVLEDVYAEKSTAD
jgi:hypothetical protein